jgi:hypothetical protein
MRKMTLLAAATGLLVLALMTAGSAWASSLLELRSDHQDLPVGSRVGVEVNFQLGLCWSNEAGYGTLTSNREATDTIAKIRESNRGSECTESSEGKQDTETGNVTSVTLTAAGQATVKLSVKLHIYESNTECSYSFKKLEGSFQPGGEVNISGEALGKLVSKESGAGCAKTRSTPWWWVSFDDGIGSEAPQEEYVTESELVA